MTVCINDRIQKLAAELTSIRDKDERLRFIISKGRELPPVEENLKIDAFLVKGCISKAWLVPKFEGNRISFMADSEAAVVKGIIAILLAVYSGCTAEEIRSTDPEFLKNWGISEHLSMNRRNGLSNIIGMIQNYARAHQV